ncbi:MAG: histidinol-phosphate transaminase [Actinomycetota bacterium]
MSSLRPDLEGLEPYRAPQIHAAVRLNTNECPYPLPEEFLQDLRSAISGIPLHRYPDREATELREGIAEHAGVAPDEVCVGNGSNEVIQQVCLAYGGAERRALVFAPTYALHSLIPRVVGMDVVAERLDPAFRLPSDAAETCARRDPAIVFICSPNNPTGNAQQVSALEPICETTDGLVVVDEAYGEFGGESAKPLLARYENLVVVRTFSKAFALAAARIGYCLVNRGVADNVSRVRLPYHLSALAQAAGSTALRHSEAALAILDRVRAERDRLVRELATVKGVEVFPSDANFVLFRTIAPADAVWKGLLERDVLVRDVSEVPGLERCLRVSAGTQSETGAFLEALPAAVKEAA